MRVWAAHWLSNKAGGNEVLSCGPHSDRRTNIQIISTPIIPIKMMLVDESNQAKGVHKMFIQIKQI